MTSGSGLRANITIKRKCINFKKIVFSPFISKRHYMHNCNVNEALYLNCKIHGTGTGPWERPL